MDITIKPVQNIEAGQDAGVSPFHPGADLSSITENTVEIEGLLGADTLSTQAA